MFSGEKTKSFQLLEFKPMLTRFPGKGYTVSGAINTETAVINSENRIFYIFRYRKRQPEFKKSVKTLFQTIE